MITKEAIEAAAKELLAHGEFWTSDGANRRNAVVAAEAALTAAFAAMPGPAVKVEYASRTTGGFYPSSALTPATDLASENERLRAALEKLVKSANEVNRLGASTGPQWLKMTVAIVSARAALERT